MNRTRIAGMATPAALALMVSTASAQITDAHVQELIRTAAERAGAPTQGGPPSLQTTTGADARPTVALTLDDAIKLALDRNLDIAVQRLNPQTFDYSLASLRAIYKPALTSTIGTNSNLQPPLNTLQGVPKGELGITSTQATYNGGLG